jgi:hypothetical protein
LFENRIPRNGIEYFFSVLALILLSIFYEFLIAYYTVLEATWGLNITAAVFPYKLPGQDLAIGSPPYSIAATRFILKFITSTLGYALMLVTMTFNVGLFFAVVFGLAVGHVLFVGLAKRALFRRRGGGDGGEDVDVGASCC